MISITAWMESSGAESVKLKHVFLQSGTNIPKHIELDNVVVVDLLWKVTTLATRTTLGIPAALNDAKRPENYSLPTDPLPRQSAAAVAIRKQRAEAIRKTMWDTLFLTERKLFSSGNYTFAQGMSTDGK